METIMVIFIILIVSIPGTSGSECSDAAESENISYIRICEDGNMTSDTVILDTHTAGATGETTCSCIVTSTLVFQMSIQHYRIGLNPSTSGCDSEIVTNDISEVGERNFKCNTSPEVPYYIRPINITWRGGSGGDSKYCLNVTGIMSDTNNTLTITCLKPRETTTGSPTLTSTTTTAVPTSQTIITTQGPSPTTATTVTTQEPNPTTVTTVTTQEPNPTTEQTSAVTTKVSTDQGKASTSPMTSQTTTGPTTDTSTPNQEESLPLIIIIPAAAGGFLLILIIVIVVIVCLRKHGKSTKGRDSYIDDTIDPYGTSNRTYSDTGDNNDDEGDGMKQNILYHTSGYIQSNGNYSSVELPQPNSPEAEYSQVQKNKPKGNDDDKQNTFELSNLDGTGNDMYAVVDKSKKKKPDDESTNTSYKTEDGLLYVKVDTTGVNETVHKSNITDNLEDTDKTDIDHVAYAQVVVT